MTRISKEIVNVIIETGISMLKIVKDLNEKEQLFPTEQLKIEKGKEDVDAAKSNDTKNHNASN